MPIKLQAEEIVMKGTPVSRGIAIGIPFFLNQDEVKIFESEVQPYEMEREIARYRTALSRSRQDIKRLQKLLESEAAVEGVLILDSQLEMLQDPLLTTEIESEIRTSNKNAEFIFQQAIEKFQKKFESLGDAFFNERFNDIKDISRRVLGYLHDSGSYSLNFLPPNSIVCAQELTAYEAAEATSVNVAAFITENGGSTSHAAIMAKSKGIPYITNINLQTIKKNADQSVVVDALTGEVFLNPTLETILKYENLKQEMNRQNSRLENLTQRPAETYDGYKIKLTANLEMTEEVELINKLGGAGIGLFRSEYIFLPKNEIPTEEEQYKIYLNVVEKMKESPVVIRTFDLGGDKRFPHSLSVERNSFLNDRATRSLLIEKGIFKSQIRAILRANIYGNVSILFPMITTLSELQEVKNIVKEAQRELGQQNSIRVGCMIEVPSAALMVDSFIEECDFFSIGTNDLVQYTLASDRGDQAAREVYNTTDPSLVRLIKFVINHANRGSVPVCVCGEIASDPRFTPLLLGLGVQELSVTPRSLPIIKNAVRNLSIVEAVRIAEKALKLKTAREVFELLSQEYEKTAPHDLLYHSSVYK